MYIFVLVDKFLVHVLRTQRYVVKGEQEKSVSTHWGPIPVSVRMVILLTAMETVVNFIHLYQKSIKF